MTNSLAMPGRPRHGSPRARNAAVAADKVQPVPWSFVVGTRSASRRVTSPPLRTTSGDAPTFEMPPFHDDRAAGPTYGDPAGGLDHAVDVRDRHGGEEPRLAEVRGHDLCEREQTLDVDRDRVVVEQLPPGGRHEHGIDDQIRKPPRLVRDPRPLRRSLKLRASRSSPPAPQVGQDRLDLQSDQLGFHRQRTPPPSPCSGPSPPLWRWSRTPRAPRRSSGPPEGPLPRLSPSRRSSSLSAGLLVHTTRERTDGRPRRLRSHPCMLGSSTVKPEDATGTARDPEPGARSRPRLAGTVRGITRCDHQAEPGSPELPGPSVKLAMHRRAPRSRHRRHRPRGHGHLGFHEARCRPGVRGDGKGLPLRRDPGSA